MDYLRTKALIRRILEIESDIEKLNSSAAFKDLDKELIRLQSLKEIAEIKSEIFNIKKR